MLVDLWGIGGAGYKGVLGGGIAVLGGKRKFLSDSCPSLAYYGMWSTDYERGSAGVSGTLGSLAGSRAACLDFWQEAR